MNRRAKIPNDPLVTSASRLVEYSAEVHRLASPSTETETESTMGFAGDTGCSS